MSRKSLTASYTQADGRVVRIGKKGRLTRFLADGATLDPEQISTPQRPPPAPKKPKKDFVGNQYLVDANPGRPGQGCLPDGRDAICGDCVHFILKSPYGGVCALWRARMTKVTGEAPTFRLDAAAGPDFAPRARLEDAAE
jgi:hypothetical protein